MAKKRASTAATTQAGASPAPAKGGTALAQALLAVSNTDEARTKLLKQVHPLFAQHQREWTLLADAYEGAGGFLDGTYLEKFPAEIADDYAARCKQARYHNFQETLVDIYVRHVFGGAITRTTKNTDLQDWWKDVDGAGTAIGDFMQIVCTHALNQGHCGVLVDKTPDAATGPAKADEQAQVVASVYTADAILDWRQRRTGLTAVKLAECGPEPAITDDPSDIGGDDSKQYLLWDTQDWARFNAQGELVADQPHALGMVPLAVLRPKPSKRYPFLGRPLTNASIVRALFNRASEEDHVLRNQGFSLLAVTVPADSTADAVEDARKEVAANYGVTRAIVSVGNLGYASPDMQIPTTIRENIQFLIRELYRAAHIAFQRDSLDAESAESLRIKHVELNEMLRALAQALTAVERQMARFWFGWTDAGTMEAVDAAFEAAEVSIQYPQEFFTKELEDDLRAWAEAVRFGLPDLFVKRMKKRVVRRIEPDIPVDVAKKVDDAIDAMPDDSASRATVGMTPEQLKAKAQERLKAFTQKAEDAAAAAGQAGAAA